MYFRFMRDSASRCQGAENEKLESHLKLIINLHIQKLFLKETLYFSLTSSFPRNHHWKSLELWCYTKKEFHSSPFNVCWLSLGEVNLCLPLFLFILIFSHEHVHLQDFNLFFFFWFWGLEWYEWCKTVVGMKENFHIEPKVFSFIPLFHLKANSLSW